MQIFWHGFSSVRIEAKQGDSEATLLTDPYSNETGLRFPRTVQPDVIALSHQDASRFNLEGATSVEAGHGKPFLVTDPGEYEVKGIAARAIQDPGADKEDQRPILYRFDAEGISVAFLGQIKRQPTPLEVEELGDIDILLVPVGGGDVLDAKAAAEVVATIEPRMVVPLYYDLPGIKESLGSVEAFCKQFAGARQDMTKLKISKKDLPADDMAVVVLERA